MKRDLTAAAIDGREAGRLQLAKDLNPYPDHSPEARTWEYERREELVRRMRPEPAPAPA